MRQMFLIVCLMMTSGIMADEVLPVKPEAEKSNLRLPELPADANPQPKPSEPVPVADLNAGELYVIESMLKPCLIADSRQGIVTIKKMTGPVSFYAKFADGKNRMLEEERTYTGAHIYVIKAAQRGTVELLIIEDNRDDPAGSVETAPLTRRTLNVMGLAPQPPPGPGPTPPGPKPPLPDNAVKRVLIIRETSQMGTYPIAQRTMFTSATFLDYLRKVVARTPDGVPEYRIWDKDTDLTQVPEVWKTAMAMPRNALPWIIISDGISEGYGGPLPETEAETIALIKQYFGE